MPIQEHEIRTELSQILASMPFNRSARISDFLRYIVEESLMGRKERIKAFTIAQDVFERNEQFDPQRDTIVRVEAGRLRRRLSEYYASTENVSVIRIEIPLGGYVPKFSRIRKMAPSKKPWVAIALTGAVVSIAAAWWLWFGNAGDNLHSPKPESPVKVEQPSPFIAILPLNVSANDSREKHLAEGLVESLITQLTKLSGLSVMAHASMIEFGQTDLSIQFLKDSFGITHILRGNLQLDGAQLRINLQLVDTETSETIWAEYLEQKFDKTWSVQEQLANQITEVLAVKIQAEEKSNFLQKHSDNIEALAFYRQAWLLIFPPNDLIRIMTARTLFKRVSELDPGFAGGYAGEGFSHAVMILFLNTSNPESELEISFRLAQKAIETDPTFGMGYVISAFAHAMSGNVQQGLESARVAAKLSPGDDFVQFMLGVNLIISGKPDAAFDPLNRALKLNPAEPRTPYLNVLGIAYYAHGDYEKAIEQFNQNNLKGGPRGPHMDIFKAAALVLHGKSEEARRIVETLNTSFPDFPYKSWLEKWLGTGDKLDRSIDGLKLLGLHESA